MSTARIAKPKPSEVRSGCEQLWSGSPLGLAKVWDNVLTEMLGLFFPPGHADSDVEMLNSCVARTRAYVEDLAEFPPAVLERAWRDVRRAHKVERWPTIAAIRDACFDAMPKRAPTALVVRQDRKAVERYPFAADANAALATPQGQWCLRHSCGLAFWERVAEGLVTIDERGNRIQTDPPARRDLPDRREIQEIFEAVERNAAAVATGRLGAGAVALANIWKKRMEMEAQLATQYLDDRSDLSGAA